MAWLLLARPLTYSQPLPEMTSLSSLVRKTIPIQDTLVLDSLSVAAHSLKIEGISPADFHFNAPLSVLTWVKKPPLDSVRIQYRILPFSFSKPHFHHDLGLIDSTIAFPFHSFLEQDLQKENTAFVSFKKIDFQGTYGRSLTLGNKQDVTLNSNFDLQLNGYILDSVRVEAALTDNNIPFQPDGNTQRVQEFDKVYITFEKQAHLLTVGDYEIKRPNSYFLNFDKRVQGLYYEGNFKHHPKIKSRSKAGFSVAKGEFARNIFEGKEGNQGPYKLTGNNGEQFFIVLAGSEKVYINGLLMERGEDRDYIIDYNTAELRFMPRRLITKDARIQIEFEYQNRNYLNTLFYLAEEVDVHDRWHFQFHGYSNQDAKNQNYQQDLDAGQKQFLRSVGGQVNQAFFPSIQPDTLGENKVLYRLTDSLVEGVLYDSVFVYSTAKDSTLYRLGFSYVGENKGNYRLSASATNGRSYEWIAPEAGQARGNYAPYILLITPKQQQFFSVAAQFDIDSQKQVGVELASSFYNVNTFGPKSETKSSGMAGRVFYKGKRPFGIIDSLGQQAWEWKNELNLEWNQATFKALAPYRNVEFERDWTLDLSDSAGVQRGEGQELLVKIRSMLQRQGWGSLDYQFSTFRKGNWFEAYQNQVNLSMEKGNYKGGALFNLTSASELMRHGAFFRPSAFMERSFPKVGNLVLGTKWELERIISRDRQTELLLPASTTNNNYSVYLKNQEEQKWHFKLIYLLREDFTPNGRDFGAFATAQTIEGLLNVRQWKRQQISLTAAYRQLQSEDSALINSASGGQNILARLQHNGMFFKGLFVPTTIYEIGSGQQQKQEYIYVKVPQGQGVYMWVDYNGDGVQQENEFEPAIYPDQKEYIRILSPTNEYVNVRYTLLNQSFLLNPSVLWSNGKLKNYQKFLSLLSNQFSLQVNNKTLAENDFGGFNPYRTVVGRDNQLIMSQSSLNNTLFFNQLNPIWGFNYSFIKQQGKTLLTYGLEGQGRKQHQLVGRYAFAKQWTLKLKAEEGERSFFSALADDGRSYELEGRAINPELSWLWQNKLRLQLGYRQEQRVNASIWGGEEAKMQSMELQFRLQFPKTGRLNLTGSYIQIAFDGEENGPLALPMLDALKNGRNWLWHLSWERNIGQGIQISLDYDGRKPGTAPFIHSGTMSVRALL